MPSSTRSEWGCDCHDGQNCLFRGDTLVTPTISEEISRKSLILLDTAPGDDDNYVYAIAL